MSVLVVLPQNRIEMRLILSISPNKVPVPFNYQEKLVGAFHFWLGSDNPYHSDTSFYSLSWLSNGRKQDDALTFPNGSQWYISAVEEDLIKQVVRGIQQQPQIAYGLSVTEVAIMETPAFTNEHRFMTASPVLVKDNLPNGKQQFYYYNNPESSQILTRTLQYKLNKAGLPAHNVSVEFDSSYPKAQIKKTIYKGIDNKGSICPIIIRGTPQQIAFAWNAGVGNSTGIGFGALI